MTDAYERTTYHGKPMDVATKSAIQWMEHDLGYELTITQGIGGAAASSGTHLGRNGEGGRAVDLAPQDWKRKLRVGLRHGFIGWHRPRIFGLWPEHVHMVLVLGRLDNDRGIAPAAFRQIRAYMTGRDGLKSNAHDSSNRPDDLEIFIYPPKDIPVPPFSNGITKTRDLLTEVAHELGEAAVLLETVKRPTAAGNARMRGHAVTIRGVRRVVNGVLKLLPKR